jgi:hypothetical protein
MSLYRAYFVPGGMDPFGLWTIKRKGGPWAQAVPDSRQDTILALAKKVRLNEEEAGRWLKIVGLGPGLWPLPDADQSIGEQYCDLPEFWVPNQIAMYTTDYHRWFYLFPNIAIKNGRKVIDGLAGAYETIGFRVTIHRDAHDKALFQSMWTMDGIYMVYAAGHGSDESGAFGWGADPNTDFIFAEEVSPPYKLAQVGMFSCNSSDVFPGFMGWYEHVSKYGSFMGHDGWANFWEFPEIRK